MAPTQGWNALSFQDKVGQRPAEHSNRQRIKLHGRKKNTTMAESPERAQ
jgi:hypothetical protein